MIVDHRTYRIKPTGMQKHLDIYGEFGFAAQSAVGRVLCRTDDPRHGGGVGGTGGAG